MFRVPLIFVSALALAFLAGCGAPSPPIPDGRTVESNYPPQPDVEIALGQDEAECVVMVVVDLSGSFHHHLMVDDGKAWDFLVSVTDQYFRNRLGNHDRLIFAQISGTQHSLVWEGEPQQLRQEFASADDFRRFLVSKSDPRGSRVHDGLTNAVNYLAADPGVAGRRAKSAVFVLSDMDDNGPEPEKSAERLVKSLSRYGQLGGIVGLYYVDQSHVPTWRQRLATCSLRESTVQSGIVGRPKLPNIE